MKYSIAASVSVTALVMLGAPAFAQMSPNMPGMSMGSTSNNSTPAAGNTTDQAPRTNDAKESMPGMDMSKMAAGNGKHRCMMHMTKTSMSMSKGNHHCGMMRGKRAMGPM